MMGRSVEEWRILADLALLICPDLPTYWDTRFIDKYWRVFIQHDEQLGHHHCSWTFSDELILGLLNQFPYDQVGKISWVTQVMIDFEQRRRGFTIVRPPAGIGTYLEPDIVPAIAAENTKTAWVDLLLACLENEPLETYIASHPDQKTAKVTASVNETVVEAEIVNEPETWDELINRSDPWHNNGLPYDGEFPYIPPKHWGLGYPFPHGHSQRGDGLIDDKGQVWVWDPNEQHWDVQFARQGYEQYIRVAPDGKLLD